MSDRWQTQREGLERAMKALYASEPPTEADIAEHQRLVARELARAEARREQSPQMALEDSR